jgi:hypothetical protein
VSVSAAIAGTIVRILSETQRKYSVHAGDSRLQRMQKRRSAWSDFQRRS